MTVTFPEVLDATTMSAFGSCPRLAQLSYIEHWKPRGQSVHLHAGAAYARGLEVAREAFYALGKSKEDSEAEGLIALFKAYGDFQCPPDSAKSAERTAGALEYYFHSYPFGEDDCVPLELPGGKLGIEFSFLEPLDILHPETGNPILYSGRFDMLCTKGNMTLGLDDKTASQLGASWPRQWDLRSQFTGYCFGAQRAGIKIDGFLVRGLSILKTKYETMEAITYRPQWQIDRWEQQLLRSIARMIEAWKEGYWDYNLGESCNAYGGCSFRQACLMKDPSTILSQSFERRQWNPVTREETLL